MIKKLVVLAVAVFLLGWLSHILYDSLAPVQATPLPQGAELVAEPPNAEFAARSNREKPSPADRLRLEDVHVSDRMVVIDEIAGRRYETAIFTDTNSMDPVIDKGSQAIQIVPLTPDEIVVGDIISYDSGSYGVIIHRVVHIGTDEKGWYAIVKGDNNPAPDPVKVRFNMVKRILVGVLY